MTHRYFYFAIASMAALLGVGMTGCSTTGQGAGGRFGAAPAPVSLASEQHRLKALFEGTPVTIEMTLSGALHTSVPLKYSFDRGQSAVKPPLAAVLDRLVPSLMTPGRRVRISAPLDVNSSAGSLAQQRGASIRDYFIAQGVPLARIAALATSAGSNVELVIEGAGSGQ